MAPTGPAYNVDWVFASNSNIHIAKHRDWFSTFTPFRTEFFDAYGMSKTGTKVEGIGDVILPVKKHRERTGKRSQGTLKLRDVLYAPKALCNVFTMTKADQINVRMNWGSEGSSVTDVKTGACLAVLDNVRLFRLRLTGQTPTQTSLDKDGAYMVNANWPESERERWLAFKQQAGSSNKLPKLIDMTPGIDSPPYTAEEKRWLKENYKDEFHFLRTQGLSIYNEEDREEGRGIVRAFMEEEVYLTDDDDDNYDEEDNDAAWSEGDEQDELDERSSFERDLEEYPESHVADYHFSKEQLDWIKAHYRFSSNFLFSYGLKSYDNDDCKEGVTIVKQLMRDD